jgi:hypothetical protein
MDQLLYKYLVLHKNLSIPQLGSFVIKNAQSHFDSATGLLHAPRPMIFFTDGIIPMSEKLFFDFLSIEMGVDEVTAIKQFHDYAYQLRKDLLENRKVAIEGIGTLTKEEDESILFNPANDLSELFPPVQNATAMISATDGDESDMDDASGVTAETDQWWIYAIILLIIGGGALLYYYI